MQSRLVPLLGSSDIGASRGFIQESPVLEDGESVSENSISITPPLKVASCKMAKSLTLPKSHRNVVVRSQSTSEIKPGAAVKPLNLEFFVSNTDPANATASSSGFIIESVSDITSSDIDQVSPVPFIEDLTVVKSPHEPPFDATSLLHQGRTSIRQSLINDQNGIFPTPVDNFHGYLSERMIRWRPSDSQYNVEATMEGKHPFQSKNFHPISSKQYGFLGGLTNWILPRNREDGSETVRATGNTDDSNTTVFFSADDFLQKNQNNKDSPDFTKLLHQHILKPNSSNSIIPSPQIERPSPNSLAVFVSPPTDIINDEPLRVNEPAYTPLAVSFNEMSLNFEKLENDGNGGYHNGLRVENDILTSIDGDVRDIIDDFDHVLAGCVNGMKKIFNSIDTFCNRIY